MLRVKLMMRLIERERICSRGDGVATVIKVMMLQMRIVIVRMMMLLMMMKLVMRLMLMMRR